jgi:hypothetical protein
MFICNVIFLDMLFMSISLLSLQVSYVLLKLKVKSVGQGQGRTEIRCCHAQFTKTEMHVTFQFKLFCAMATG